MLLLQEIKRQIAVDTAKAYVGEREISPNWSPMIEVFQKEVDGKANREPWCCAFVIWVCDETDRKFFKLHGTDSPKNVLFRSKSCLEVWNKTPLWARVEKPFRGCLMVWQHFNNGEPSQAGHIGLIQEVDRGQVIRYRTIEGNTSQDATGQVVREGEGVYEKYRTPVGSESMRVLGYLDPWAEAPAPEIDPALLASNS